MIQSILEYILQTLSQHHTGYSTFINQHCGKRCQLHIGQWSTTLQVHRSGVLFCDNITTENHIFIQDLLSILGLDDAPPNIEFQGDIGFCQDFAKLLSSQHIDIDGLLFSILPDTLAMLSLEGLDLYQHTLFHTKSQLRLYLKDYLTHETGICATKEETNMLYEKTQKLKWIVESMRPKNHLNN